MGAERSGSCLSQFRSRTIATVVSGGRGHIKDTLTSKFLIIVEGQAIFDELLLLRV